MYSPFPSSCTLVIGEYIGIGIGSGYDECAQLAHVSTDNIGVYCLYPQCIMSFFRG